MTIYLDYIFIENFLIDYLMLKETSYIARKNTTTKRVIISSVISSLYVVLMMCLKLEELNYLICKLLLVVIMIYISFEPKRIDEHIKLIALFFLISVINVGTLIVITNLLNLKDINTILKIITYLVSLFLSKSCMKNMWQIYKRQIRDEDLIYEVVIRLDNKKYKYKAFLDTGNNVYSYTYNVPIIFAEVLDKTMLKAISSKEFFNIRTVTLSSECNKRAYIIENVEIRKKDRAWNVKVGVVFENTKLSKDHSYNMLLNYVLYTQDLGGIKI